MASLISLDRIVKNLLLVRRYPFQYYLDFLVYARNGMREIAFDEKILCPKYKLLPVTDYRITLPDDYQDYIRVSVRVNQYIVPLAEDDALQLVPNYDSNFDVQPYSQGVATSANSSLDYLGGYGYAFPFWFVTNWNNWGENTGRQFGGTNYVDNFKVDKIHNQIKINEDLSVTEVLLEYISDGSDPDSASHIDSYAQAAIEAYAMWQFKENNRTYGTGDAEMARQIYINERQKLRARLSNLTIDNLKRLIQKNQRAIQY